MRWAVYPSRVFDTPQWVAGSWVVRRASQLLGSAMKMGINRIFRPPMLIVPEDWMRTDGTIWRISHSVPRAMRFIGRGGLRQDTGPAASWRDPRIDWVARLFQLRSTHQNPPRHYVRHQPDTAGVLGDGLPPLHLRARPISAWPILATKTYVTTWGCRITGARDRGDRLSCCQTGALTPRGSRTVSGSCGR